MAAVYSGGRASSSASVACGRAPKTMECQDMRDMKIEVKKLNCICAECDQCGATMPSNNANVIHESCV